MPIVQIRKWSPREVKQYAPGGTAKDEQSEDRSQTMGLNAFSAQSLPLKSPRLSMGVLSE